MTFDKTKARKKALEAQAVSPEHGARMRAIAELIFIEQGAEYHENTGGYVFKDDKP